MGSRSVFGNQCGCGSGRITTVCGCGGTTNNAILVERMIGTAYDIVKMVAHHLDCICDVSKNIEELLALSENLEQFINLYEHREEYEYLYEHREEFTSIFNQLDALVAVEDNIDALVAVSANINNILQAAIDAVAAKNEAQIIVNEIIDIGSDAVSQGNVPIYAYKVSVESLTIPSAITALRTNGYHSAGDGGAALYKRIASEPSHEGKVQSVDGAWWEIAESTINVKMFGAKGDGLNNDTASIQSALDYAESIGGADVLLPSGTYGITSTIRIPSSCSLIGAGLDSTKITQISGSRFDYVNNKDLVNGDTFIRISDIYFVGKGDVYGWSAVGPGAAVRFYNSSNIIVERCRVTNATTYGIEMKGTNEFIIDKCFISQAGDDCISITSRDDFTPHFPIKRIRRGIVSNCFLTNPPGPDGLSLSGTGTGSGVEIDDGPLDIIVENCVAYNCVNGFDTHSHSGFDAVGNISFIGCRASGCSRSGFAISVFGTDNTPSNIKIINCESTGNKSHGIHIAKVTAVVVEGCYIRNNEMHGIRLDPGSSINKAPKDFSSITNNIIIYNGLTGLYFAQQDGDEVFRRGLITGNNIANNGQYGIHLGYVQFSLINNNMITSNSTSANGAYSNIHLWEGVNETRISENFINAGGGANRPPHGIRINSGAANGVWIEGNHISDGYTSTLINNQAGSTVRLGQNGRFVSQNKGSATIPVGESSVTVNAGLSAPLPTTGVQATARRSMAENSFWVDNFTDTSFDIVLEAPAGSTLYFSWSASL